MVSNVTSRMMLDQVTSYLSTMIGTLAEHDPDDGDHATPGELRRFLGGLRLLKGVPFSYLVPDSRLLPLESIRFFYLDRAWTDALTQGVLSVGTITTADRAQLEAMYPHIRAEVDQAERVQRRPKDEERLEGAGGTITGFLIRSKLVSGWPNMHVRAYSRDVLPDDALSTVAESHPDRMKVLRLERLAPAVLLALIDGVPEVIHLEEPRQGIQFGVRNAPGDPGDQRRVKVRRTDTGAAVPPVESFTDTNSVTVPFRRNAPGVIDMVQLAGRLRDTAPGAGPALESNEYALQMLRFPYRQVFGDPDEVSGTRFYDLDQFAVKLSVTAWTSTVQAHLRQAQTKSEGQ
ncbi:hypothetical protein SRABI26_00391 [Arthrobacter sp. Bi26]|uniref:hypothetical protein n=1 Tax=Arthrobacter sp. Bi26 TaxID=2822350 RepID=UPI001DE12DE1|nr:hypothetical protein [Arthrobacter sp. Bi26]CAH0137546.1 hypothetical protein SRABI26_00391 [Arthrobacter sp. Bi26]